MDASKLILRFAVLMSMTFYAGCNATITQQKGFKITQIFPFQDKVDTINTQKKMKLIKYDYFILENYKDNFNVEKSIDSFAQKIGSKEALKYDNYFMAFYKESANTTVEKVKANPRIIDDYSNGNDLIYDYSWQGGKFEFRNKLKEGEIIESNHRTIKVKIKSSPGK